MAWAMVVLLGFMSLDGLQGGFFNPVEINDSIRLSLLLFTLVVAIEALTCIVFGFGIPKDQLVCKNSKRIWVAVILLFVFTGSLWFYQEGSKLWLISGMFITLVVARFLTLTATYCLTARTKEIRP